MKTMKILLLSGVLLTIFNLQVYAQYAVWQHTKSMFILTTPEGANLPFR